MEVASTQCGSDEKLHNAVQRGAVLKKGKKGLEMYYFPKEVIGNRKEFEASESTSSVQERSIEDAGNFGESVTSFFGSDFDMMADMAHQPQSNMRAITCGATAPDEFQLDFAPLTDKKKRLETAIKIAEKMTEACQKVHRLPDRVAKSAIDLSEHMQKAELGRNDLDFMIKYKKTSAGQVLDSSSLVAATNSADTLVNKLIEEVKVCKALLGTMKTC